MEIIATTALISINGTFIVQLVSFLIFLYVINRIMFRPLLNTIDQRDDYIDRFKDDIVTGRDNLGQLIRELDKQRAQVIKEADAMVHSLEAEGDRRASELVEEARQQITALRHETENQVKDQVQQARQALAGEVDAITVTILEKVLHRRLSS
ncbi:MAG: ATP synthase F0 subunit B [Desulfosarcina sp.]|nr:ATP synthase F0 subunit B [Desulfosarcina sp.]MBC2744835.1 ATP synthase F0 subunit B [Desulfosarcina sp.]MBC2767743.1 ATP synthase F0 subunit B [Desulfosarcina sp.]